LKGLRAAVEAFWAAGIQEIYIDCSFCMEKPDPGWLLSPTRDELREYDQLKSGELTLPHIERLDEIAPFIAKIRIAKGLSQTELARRLGVSKQVISRYEESDYQTVAVARLQEILDAIGIRTLVTLNV
jgi:DNA-binding transcriptional regulator YiaG